jgi:GTP diphosphokinase / guanosine-3',5'-bis(diphosphate) 3'-diphosphatase
VREMLEQNDSSAIEFVDDFRSNLFNEEVFVFTPKGDLKILPNNSTALDFAFEIHSEIGAKCLGAKVNQKLVPLNYKLKNGDQIEILTSNKQKPSEDWLRLVVTNKAKLKIKEALKDDRKYVAIEGREIVGRKLRQIKLEANTDVLNQLCSFLNSKSHHDLYYKVGKGYIDPKEIKKFRYEPDKIEHRRQPSRISDVKVFEKEIDKATDNVRDMLLIGEDMNVIDYTLARCCSPIPGDDVFGFVTVNEGIKIHRTTCPNAVELLSNHGHRVIKAKWTSQQKIAFLAGLKIVGTDRLGMISDITRIISSELKVNIRSVSFDTDNGIFDGNLMLYVSDTTQLDLLISKLEKVNGVVNVNRYELK